MCITLVCTLLSRRYTTRPLYGVGKHLLSPCTAFPQSLSVNSFR